MDSKPDRTWLPAAPLAAALTALGWWFGTSLQPLWWAAWLAPLPVLLCAPRVGARTAALTAFVAIAVGGGNMWHYASEVVRLPVAATLAIILTPALLVVPVTLLFRALVLRGRLLAATFAVPLAATGLSWVSAMLSPHGTYGHLAYSQMDVWPLVQVAAVAGLWGVGFLAWLPASLVAAAAAPGGRRRSRMAAATTGIVVLAISFAYGAWRLHDDDAATRIRVGLITIGSSGDAAKDLATPEGERMLSRYVAGIERLAAQGAKIVVAPESAILVRSQAIETLQQLATRHGIRILIGAEDHSDPRHQRNAALAFDPGGGAPAAYYKQHLIPGFEDSYTPGTERTMLAGTPRVGVAICKDLDFTSTGLAYGQCDAQLLLVPAWDFDDDAWLHGRMAVLRGVEGGFAMARAARGGHLTLSDDRGRVLMQASSVATDAAVTLLGDLPMHDTWTLYARWGDAFGWLCLLAAVALGLTLVRRSSRTPATHQGGRQP